MSATVFFDHASAELATLTNTFSVSGTPTDPTTVSLAVTTPSGVTTTYTYAGSTITKTTTGVYTKDVACTEPGEWFAVWVGTGTASDIQPVRWTVFDADTALLCSVASVKSRLGDTSTANDSEYEGAVRAVTGWITQWCQDFFGRVTATRTFSASCASELDIPSLVSVTTLKTDAAGDGTFEQTWSSSTDYQLLPVNPSNGLESKPYTRLRAIGSLTFPYTWATSGQRADMVQIAGVWGWPAIPDAVREAALILSVDTLKLKDAPFGTLGFGAEGFTVRVKQNPQALSYLAPYRRYPVMVG